MLDCIMSSIIHKIDKLVATIDNHFNGVDALSYKNDSTVDLSGFLEIRQNVGARYGLFRTFKVGTGSDADVSCFGEACAIGFDLIGISPDDPAVINPARYMPGLLFDTSKISVEELSQFEDKSKNVSVKQFDTTDWYVYQHCGSYDGLKKAWKRALDDCDKRGYELQSIRIMPYEQYLNDPGATPEKDLRTHICLPIKSRS